MINFFTFLKIIFITVIITFFTFTRVEAIPVNIISRINKVSNNNIDILLPDVLVHNMVNNILKTIKEYPQTTPENIQYITSIISSKLISYTDFQLTTKLVLGRYWCKATQSQKDDLIKQFKTLLIYTYTGAILKISDQTINVKPVYVNSNTNDIIVRTEVNNHGYLYEINYRLTKTIDGWRIYDVNILGIWLIEAYQQQFANIISQQGIHGLINFLIDHNNHLFSK